jgi:hypothetical protein
MVYSLDYRRPSRVSHVSVSHESIDGTEKQRSIDESIKSSSSGMSQGIPEALSFDRIISGGTCPVRHLHSDSFRSCPTGPLTSLAMHDA